jgi:hypothetical protein
MRRRRLNVWPQSKQNNSEQEYIIIILEKDTIVRDCKRIENLRIILKVGRIKHQ